LGARGGKRKNREGVGKGEGKEGESGEKYVLRVRGDSIKTIDELSTNSQGLRCFKQKILPTCHRW